MKAALALILFVGSSFAQDQVPVPASEAACGSKAVAFTVRQDVTQHPTPQPEAGTALIYVVQDLGKCPNCDGGSNAFSTNVNQALTKVGMDGAWVGANQGSSYFFFAVSPGEHHLCINWQSRLETRSRAFAMVSFTAEEGKVYYFRERVFPGAHDYSFDLDSINSDEVSTWSHLPCTASPFPRSKWEIDVSADNPVISRVDARAVWRLRFSLLADDTGIIRSIPAKQL